MVALSLMQFVYRFIYKNARLQFPNTDSTCSFSMESMALLGTPYDMSLPEPNGNALKHRPMFKAF